MLYIIIILIIIGLLGVLIEFIKEHFGTIVGIILAIAFVVLTGGVGIIVALILWGVYAIVKRNREGKYAEKELENKTAQKNAETSRLEIRHENDNELANELDRNCKYLGLMNEQRWEMQLHNYVNREYSTSFAEITRNFAMQIEDQYIAKNVDYWMQNFEKYIVQRPSGCPIFKMLEEVDCDALRMTHITPTNKILEHYLNEGTKELGYGVKAKFTVSNADNLVIYKPTKYLMHLYENKMNGYSIQGKQIEIDADENPDFANL